jgi:hypothetical protein
MTAQMNNKRYCLTGEPTDIFAEVSFGTTGTPTLVTTTDASMGVKAIKQGLASSAVYILSLNDAYVRLRKVGMNTQGQVPAFSGVHVLSKRTAVGGSVALISCASCAAGDTVTIKVPGESAVTVTAVAYDATSALVDTKWCVGNTTGADGESANNLAGCINNVAAGTGGAAGDSNGNGGCTTMPTSVTAQCTAAGLVAVSCTKQGMTICSSNATRLNVLTYEAATVNVPKKCYPGLVVQFQLAATAQAPASGDVVQLDIILEKASRAV